jgi:hypothetical protein
VGKCAGTQSSSNPRPWSWQACHEEPELRRVAETPARCEQTEGLIAPGTVERVFADRQQFQVRETEARGVGRQTVGQLLPAGKTAVPALAPALRVHLEDADRRIAPVQCRSLGRQRTARRQAGHHAGGGRPEFGGQGTGIGAQRQQRAVPVLELVLVERTRAHARHEGRPEAQLVVHRVESAVPGIEVAHHRGAPRVGRPDGETHAGHTLLLDRVRAQDFLDVQLVGIAQAAQLVGAQHRAFQVQRLRTDQTRSTYSSMVRSLEKPPMPATLSIARSAQAASSRYSASTRP